MWVYVQFPDGPSGWILVDENIVPGEKPTHPIIDTPEGKVWVYVHVPGKGSGWVMIDDPRKQKAA